MDEKERGLKEGAYICALFGISSGFEALARSVLRYYVQIRYIIQLNIIMYTAVCVSHEDYGGYNVVTWRRELRGCK